MKIHNPEKEYSFYILESVSADDRETFEQYIQGLNAIDTIKKKALLDYTLLNFGQTISSNTSGSLLYYLERLFEEGASPNAGENTEYRPLSMLINSLSKFSPHLCAPIAKLFIKYGLNMSDMSPLSAAIQKGLPETVDALLDAGMDPNTLLTNDYSGKSTTALPLNMAVAKMTYKNKNAKEVVISLLEHGADPNLSVKKNGYDIPPALFLCTEQELAALLIKYGANVNVRRDGNLLQSSGETLLIQEVMKENMLMLEFYLKHGADPNFKDKYETTPAFYVKSAEEIKLLAKYGADFNIMTSYDMCPLCCVDPELISALVKAGADLDIQDKSGNSCLHNLLYICVKSAKNNVNSIKKVKTLIEAGADINIRNNAGETPFLTLIFTCFNTYDFDNPIPSHVYELAEYMVEHGADIYARDKSGRGIFDTKSHIIDKLKELYGHIQLTQQVLEGDISEFAR